MEETPHDPSDEAPAPRNTPSEHFEPRLSQTFYTVLAVSVIAAAAAYGWISARYDALSHPPVPQVIVVKVKPTATPIFGPQSATGTASTAAVATNAPSAAMDVEPLPKGRVAGAPAAVSRSAVTAPHPR